MKYLIIYLVKMIHNFGMLRASKFTNGAVIRQFQLYVSKLHMSNQRNSTLEAIRTDQTHRIVSIRKMYLKSI